MPVLSPRFRLFALAAALLALSLLALAYPGPASAHAFLVRSDPAAGARLTRTPTQLTLYFSEAFVPGSERVSVRTASNAAVALARPTSRGSELVQPLPRNLRGIYVVSWHVVADDGHPSDGELAFAVRASGSLPIVAASNSPIAWTQGLVSWLLFACLSLSLGGVVSERVAWRRADRSDDDWVRAPVQIGLVVALLASLLQLVLLAHDLSSGRPLSTVGALGRALGSRPGELTLLTIGAIVTAAQLALWRRRLTALPLAVVVLAMAWRGHSGSSGHAWAVVANALHLTAAAVWAGALAHLVLVIARRRETHTLELGEPVRRYATLALQTVPVMIVAGVITALGEFRDPGQLFSTSYGRVLVIKASLVALALVAALAARTRALPANPGVRLPLLRRLTRIELSILLGVLLTAGLLANTPPPPNAAAPVITSAVVLGPPPLSEPAVQLGDLAGQLVVGVATSSQELRFRVILPTESAPRPGIRLSVHARRPRTRPVELFPRACGPGCFSIRFALPPGTTTLVVSAHAPVWVGGTARFAIRWPPGPDRQALLARVAKTMRAIPRLALTEVVTSGPGSHVHPDHTILSGAQLLAQGEVYSSGATDVRLLQHRKGFRELAFALPGSDIWYRMTIDSHDRVRQETLVSSPAHLIRRVLNYPR